MGGSGGIRGQLTLTINSIRILLQIALPDRFTTTRQRRLLGEDLMRERARRLDVAVMREILCDKLVHELRFVERRAQVGGASRGNLAGDGTLFVLWMGSALVCWVLEV
jgi:hypothetical protein